jgi:hypothetical protein
VPVGIDVIFERLYASHISFSALWPMGTCTWACLIRGAFVSRRVRILRAAMGLGVWAIRLRPAGSYPSGNVPLEFSMRLMTGQDAR